MIGGSSFISPVSAAAELEIVDDARARPNEVRPRHARPVDRELPQRHLQAGRRRHDAMSRPAPGGAHRADGLAAAGVRSSATPMRMTEGWMVANSRANLAMSAPARR